MKKLYIFITLVLVVSGLYFYKNQSPTTSVLGLTSTDWPQVQKDPQHTGFSSETLGTNFAVRWTRAFQPERVYPQVQAIIASGKVFVGTEQGNLYALDAVTGSQSWKFTAGGPIVNSVATDGTNIYFGSLDGAVYAVNFSGQQVWKQYLYNGQGVTNAPRIGFSTAPVFADGKIMLGGRDGYFYALNPTNGSLIWAYNAGAPILQTAAWNNGKAYFGSMDMYVHAVTTSSGVRAWKSARIAGLSFKDYWPVVTQGKVIVIPWGQKIQGGIQPGHPFVWGTSSSWLATNGPTVASGNLTQVTDAMNAQNQVMANFTSNPNAYTPVLNILDEATGTRAFDVPHFDTQILHGAFSPPCVDRDNRLTIPVFFIKSGWGRLDLNQKRYVDILYDGTDAGFGNGDENMNVSCSQNLILGTHTNDMDGRANYSGGFNLDTRRWTRLAGGKRNTEMWNNDQAGGGSPVSISNGMIYHVSAHELIVRATN